MSPKILKGKFDPDVDDGMNETGSPPHTKETFATGRGKQTFLTPPLLHVTPLYVPGQIILLSKVPLAGEHFFQMRQACPAYLRVYSLQDGSHL